MLEISRKILRQSVDSLCGTLYNKETKRKYGDRGRVF